MRLIGALNAEALKKARHVANVIQFALAAVAQAKNELVVGVVHWKRDLCADEVIGDKVDILGCSPEYALRRVSQVYTARQPEKRGSVGGKVASGVDFYSPALLNRHYLQKLSVNGRDGPVSFGHDVM